MSDSQQIMLQHGFRPATPVDVSRGQKLGEIIKQQLGVEVTSDQVRINGAAVTGELNDRDLPYGALVQVVDTETAKKGVGGAS